LSEAKNCKGIILIFGGGLDALKDFLAKAKDLVLQRKERNPKCLINNTG